MIWLLVLYRVNDEVRTRLKHPFGRLIVGQPEVTIKALKEVVNRDKPIKLVTIGDTVTSNMLHRGIEIDLVVIDTKTKREAAAPILLDGFEVFKVVNPSGIITVDAFKAMEVVGERLIQGCNRIAVVVDGEEDLITLLAVKFVPLGSLIIYGQPDVGIVLITVTDVVKKEVDQLMDKMVI